MENNTYTIKNVLLALEIKKNYGFKFTNSADGFVFRKKDLDNIRAIRLDNPSTILEFNKEDWNCFKNAENLFLEFRNYEKEVINEFKLPSFIKKVSLNHALIRTLNLEDAKNLEVLDLGDNYLDSIKGLYDLKNPKKFQVYDIEENIDYKKLLEKNPKLKVEASITQLSQENIKDIIYKSPYTKNINIIEPIYSDGYEYIKSDIKDKNFEKIDKKIEEIASSIYTPDMTVPEKIMMTMLFTNTNNRVPVKFLSRFSLYGFKVSNAVLYNFPAWCQAKVKFSKLLLNKIGIQSQQTSCALRKRKPYDIGNDLTLDNIEYMKQFGLDKKDYVDHSIMRVKIQDNWTYCDPMNIGFSTNGNFLENLFNTNTSLNETKMSDEQVYVLSGAEKIFKGKQLSFSNFQKQQIFTTMLAKYLSSKDYQILNPMEVIENKLLTEKAEDIFKQAINIPVQETVYVDNLEELKSLLIDRSKVEKIVSKDKILEEDAIMQGYTNIKSIKKTIVDFASLESKINVFKKDIENKKKDLFIPNAAQKDER